MNLHEEQERVRKAVSNSLSHVQEDPWLTQRVLANVKGEKTVVKKISTSMIIIIALLIVSMSVVLAAANWSGISDFLGKTVGGWTVNEEAIVKPVSQSNTSKWLKLDAAEAYWAEDGLSVVLKVDTADDHHMVCYEFEHGLLNDDGELSERIEINGKIITLDQWRGEKELIMTEFVPHGEGWTWYKRNDDGLFVIVTSSGLDEEALKKGTTLAIQIYSNNIQTGEKEESLLTISLPAMTMQEGHK